MNLSSVILRFPSVALRFAAYNLSMIDDCLRRTRQELLSGKHVVVSGEALSWLTSAGYRGFFDALGDPDVRAIFGMRELEPLLRSIWSETIRGGSTVGFGDWLGGVVGQEDEIARVLPGVKLQELLAAVGPGRVSLFHAPLALESPEGMALLESWLGLAETALGGPFARDALDLRARLSREQLVHQVIFNHVFPAVRKTPGVASEVFAREVQAKSAQVANYLFGEDDESVERLRTLEAINDEALRQIRHDYGGEPSWLEARRPQLRLSGPTALPDGG